MAFRADASARMLYEQAESYLIHRLHGLSNEERQKSLLTLEDLASDLGPVISTYPSWHPMVSNQTDLRHPQISPANGECGYAGLDHTVFFANGFITCPYTDGSEVIKSVNKLMPNEFADITAEVLNCKFYHPEATPIMVRCNWDKPLEADGTIPASVAVLAMLKRELQCTSFAEVAETWETMRPYFLGRPHGSRSSLFVNQDTGQKMKRIWNEIINTGMFGPIMV